jgi:transmembrane sensor
MELSVDAVGVVDEKGHISRDHGDSLAHMRDWPSRELVFHDRPLAEVIAEMTRYSRRPIIVLDPEVGTLEYSGAIQVNDPRSLIAALKRDSRVAVEDTPQGARIHRAAAVP